MEYFKKDKKRDQGMGLRFFVLCFKYVWWGVGFKIRVSFLCFEEMMLFCEEFVSSVFEGSTLNHSQNLISRSNIFS